MKKSKIVIYGCGGQGRSVVNVLRERNEYAEIILVDANAQEDEVILGCQTSNNYRLKEKDKYIIAVGDNTKRDKLYNLLADAGMGECISIISSFSHIGLEVEIGKGSFVAPNAYVGPQVKIGENTIINTGSVIEHEVVIGKNAHMAPHTTVCGRTRIGDGVFCGAGSIIVDGITVCNNAIIGAGATVIEDIREMGTYVGVPARKLVR